MRRSELKQRTMIRQAEISAEKRHKQEVYNRMISEEADKWLEHCHKAMEAASEAGEFKCKIKTTDMMEGAKAKVFAYLSEFSPAWILDDRGVSMFLCLRWD